ncbi:MAG: zinc ribbon domain-containing protein [Fidelibacterota bacterium]
MILPLTLLTVVLVLTYVIWPLVVRDRQDGRLVRVAANQANQELEAAVNTVLSDLKDIEFDYEIGKLTLEDFTELKSRYRRKAVELIKQIESDRTQFNPSGGGDFSARGISTGSGQKICPQCGAPYRQKDHYCGQCGYPADD